MFLALVGLFPPDSRGETYVAATALILLSSALAWRRGPFAAGLARLSFVIVGLWPFVAFSDVPGAAVRPLAGFALATAVGLGAASLPRVRRHAPRVLATLAGVGATVALYAIFQKVWGLEWLAAEIARHPELPDHHALTERAVAGRAFANFSTPAALGGYLALVLPVTLERAVAAAGRRRALWATAVGLQLVALFASASLTATAALIGAVVLVALLELIRGWRRPGALALVALVLGALLISAVAFRGGKVLSLTDPNSPWRLRGGNFRSAIAMTADHPWHGVGPGAFGEHYPQYRQEGDNETRHVHNLPLEMMAETGWPTGALLGGVFLFLFCAPLVAGVRERRGPPDAAVHRAGEEHDPAAGYRRALALGLAAFGLHNLADYTAYLPSVMWTAAAALGLWVATRPASGDRRGVPSTLTRLAAGAGAVALVLVAVVGCLDALGHDARFASRVAAFAGEEAAAASRARRATRLAPWDVDSAVLEARLALTSTAAGTTPVAASLELADRTVRLSPVRAAAHEVRARARLLAGDYAGAWSDLRQAARLHPLNPDYARARDELGRRIDSLLPTEEPRP